MNNISKPTDWKTVAFETLVADTQLGTTERGEEDGDSNIDLIKMGNLKWGGLALADVERVAVRKMNGQVGLLQAGDLLFNTRNSADLVGKSAIWRDSESPATHDNNINRIRLRDYAHSEFYGAYLSTGTGKKNVQSLAVGSTSVAAIYWKDLSKLKVPLPPLPEQRKIAEILRTWDEAIEKLEALQKAKLRSYRALTHALVFGARQLQGFRATDEAEQHRWFTLPASWGCRPIAKLAKEISERNVESEQHEVLSCSKHDGFVRSLEYFKRQVFSADLSGYKMIWRGDFGFPSNHVEEGSIGLQNLTDIGVVSPIYTVFRFSPTKVDADFAFAVMKTGLYRHIFEISTSASVDRRGSLRWSEFAKLPFPVPPLFEQRAIVDALQTARTGLDSVGAEIGALTRQKRGLMQKLLTGQWRVELEKASA